MSKKLAYIGPISIKLFNEKHPSVLDIYIYYK